MAEEKEEGPSPSRYDAAGKQIRETSKWLVASFAALGAALVGSVSLADFGELTDSGATQAREGLYVALFGVVLVVVPCALVLAPRITSLAELRSLRGRRKVEADIVLPQESCAAKEIDLADGHAVVEAVDLECELRVASAGVDGC